MERSKSYEKKQRLKLLKCLCSGKEAFYFERRLWSGISGFILAFLLSASTVLLANASAGKDSVNMKKISHRLDRNIMNHAFRVGEKLTFRIRYGIITAGYATMEVRDMVTVKDSFPAYHIVTTARSNKTFDVFYKVRDRVETFLDAKGFFSWKFNKQLREGGYKFDLLVDYQQKKGIANIQKIRYTKKEPLKIRNKDEFQMDIPEYVLDILSAFYFIRTQNLKIGEPIYLTNHDNQKIYDLKVIIEKKERKKVKAGKFDCVVVSPRLRGEGLFKQKGELWVWLTDDKYKIPVLMKSKVLVGSISTELISIEGGPAELKARRKK